MILKTATVIQGTEISISEGVTKPVRAVVRFEGATYNAVVKTLSIQHVAAECFAALLLDGWGLPVAQPLLIEGEQLRFGSLDGGYPNLKQKIGWDGNLDENQKNSLYRLGALIMSELKETPIAICADEAIGNFDRNLGNILWDGSKVAFIDHERAFGLSDDVEANKLASLIQISDKSKSIEASSVARALAFNSAILDTFECEGLNISDLKSYVSNRVNSLASRVLNRFPQPKDLFQQ